MMQVEFVMPVPSSWTKTRQQRAFSGEEPHIVKPDVDNLVKALCDAGLGILYDDDRLLVSVNALKRYGHPSGIIVTLTEWGERL